MANMRVNRIVVTFPNGRQTTVMWNRADTVARIKNHVQNKTGIPVSQQVLVWVGAESPLADERTIHGYNIIDNTSITLSILPAFRVFVKMPDCKTQVLELNSHDSVDHVMGLIASKCGMPQEEQRLMCGCHQLEASRCLRDYGINGTVNMTVLLRLRGGGSTADETNQKAPSAKRPFK